MAHFERFFFTPKRDYSFWKPRVSDAHSPYNTSLYSESFAFLEIIVKLHSYAYDLGLRACLKSFSRSSPPFMVRWTGGSGEGKVPSWYFEERQLTVRLPETGVSVEKDFKQALSLKTHQIGWQSAGWPKDLFLFKEKILGADRLTGPRVFKVLRVSNYQRSVVN